METCSIITLKCYALISVQFVRTRTFKVAVAGYGIVQYYHIGTSCILITACIIVRIFFFGTRAFIIAVVEEGGNLTVFSH